MQARSEVHPHGSAGSVPEWSSSSLVPNDWFAVMDSPAHLPVSPNLFGASPNPFNPTTALSYTLQASSHVSLKVYNNAGRLVASLVDGLREAGEHEATFDGSKLASGNFSAVQKLVLMK